MDKARLKEIVKVVTKKVLENYGIQIAEPALAKIQNYSEEPVYNFEKKLMTEAGNRSNKIGVMHDKYTWIYANAAGRVIKELKLVPVFSKPVNFTNTAAQNTADELTNKVSTGEYLAGIIINEDAFQLKRRAADQKGIIVNMCWEIGSNQSCALISNLLFVNNRLIGSKKLEEILHRWLSAKMVMNDEL